MITIPNYSEGDNIIFYIIKCKDPDVLFNYVGQTKNLKTTIRNLRNNVKTISESKTVPGRLRICEVINNNGGWDNWQIDILEEVTFKDKEDMRLRKENWIEKCSWSGIKNIF